MTDATIQIPRKYVYWLILIFVIAIILVGILLASLPISLNLLEWSYDFSGRNFEDADGNTFPYLYVAILGIVVGALSVAFTIATILVSVDRANQERKIQDTQKILLETRLSTYYQSQLDIRRKYFPIGGDAKKVLRIFKASGNSPQKATIKYLLNYYEFLAIGVLHQNLDETMIEQSLRQILCTLVFDMRLVIHHVRVVQNRPKSYEHLVKIHEMWAKKKNGEWEEGIDLGPIGEHDDACQLCPVGKCSK